MDERSNFSGSFGYWLRRRRKALDLTQVALAGKTSCSQAAIKKIEADQRRPSRGLALRLAEQLAIPAPQRPAFLNAARRLRADDCLLPDRAPVDVRRAEAASPAPIPDQLTPMPFVGRSLEYRRVLGLIGQLAAGSGQVLLIQGEAGIGKSRLLDEVAAYARQWALPTLRSRCHAIERALTYQPLMELATQACAAASQASLRLIAPILRAEIAALVPSLAVCLPELPRLTPDFPEARQARLFHALLALLDALSQGRPLIVMIDDLQCADDATLRFVHFLSRQIVHRPVLLSCACGDEEPGCTQNLAGFIDSLRRQCPTQCLALPRLGCGDIESLLEKLSTPASSRPGLAARLQRETDGNPFFVGSFLQALSDAGWAMTDALALPDGLRDALRGRLTRLPQDDRLLLDAAAVLGCRFDFDTLLTLSHLPQARFVAAIGALVTCRLLREEQQAGFYAFCHERLREVVLRDIGSARCLLLQRALAPGVGKMLAPLTQGRAPEHDMPRPGRSKLARPGRKRCGR